MVNPPHVFVCTATGGRCLCKQCVPNIKLFLWVSENKKNVFLPFPNFFECFLNAQSKHVFLHPQVAKTIATQPCASNCHLVKRKSLQVLNLVDELVVFAVAALHKQPGESV